MALPLICVFNPITTLIDQIPSAATGPAAAGTPVVTNALGVIDPSFLGTGSTTTAGEAISNGQLVNLYSVSGSLHAQLASAQGSGTAPSGSLYPVPAQGFASSIIGSTFIVNFFGTFVYIDGHSEFSTGSIGATVFLSAVTPGGVTLTPPGALAQTVGTVVGFSAPNIVTVNFGLTATPVAAGINTAVQYNSSGTFAGDTTNFFWNDSTKALQIGASGSSAVVIKPLALTFFGSASGSASIGVPAAAG